MRELIKASQNNVNPNTIVGVWTKQGSTVNDVRITFNADGTYTHFENGNTGGCKTGVGSGTYQWQPSTGVLVARVVSDLNGGCGLSDPRGGYFRFVANGNSISILDGVETFPMVGVP